MANMTRKSFQNSRDMDEVCRHLLKKESGSKDRGEEDCTAVKQEIREVWKFANDAVVIHLSQMRRGLISSFGHSDSHPILGKCVAA